MTAEIKPSILTKSSQADRRLPPGIVPLLTVDRSAKTPMAGCVDCDGNGGDPGCDSGCQCDGGSCADSGDCYGGIKK